MRQKRDLHSPIEIQVLWDFCDIPIEEFPYWKNMFPVFHSMKIQFVGDLFLMMDPKREWRDVFFDLIISGMVKGWLIEAGYGSDIPERVWRIGWEKPV